MGENSSGEEAATEKIPEFSEGFSRKTRSPSIDSTKLSVSEINKIIGTKSMTEIKTYLGKQRKTSSNADKDLEIPGEVDKLKLNFNKFGNNKEAFNSPSDVFKPRNSVSRTPPPVTNKKNEKEEKTSGKRLGPEISPELQNQNKKQCEGIKIIDDNDKNNHSEPTTQINNNNNHIAMDKLLVEIFESLDQIQNVSNKQDQDMVRTATTSIHKALTLITYKIGQLEQEKMALEYKIKLQDVQDKNITKSNLASQTPQNEKNQRTYATITHKNLQINTTPEVKMAEKWVTPKTSKKLETIVRIDNVTDPKQTIQQLKQEISTKDINGGFKNIRQLKSGAIVVESCNETQQKKLKLALENKNNIKIKESQNLNPMFMITGILKGYSDTEFVEELIRLNDEIQIEFPTINIRDDIKVITKRQCRNPSKENWILEAQPTIAKWFLKKQTVNFDLMKVYVQEHLNLALCYSCSGFGHVAKHCKETICCYKCGANDHYGKECKEALLKCPNCIKMKYMPEDSQHSARDINCPIYKKRLISYRSQINYTDGSFF